MAKTLTISLSDRTAAALERLVDEQRFGSASEAVDAAVAQLSADEDAIDAAIERWEAGPRRASPLDEACDRAKAAFLKEIGDR